MPASTSRKDLAENPNLARRKIPHITLDNLIGCMLELMPASVKEMGGCIGK